MFILWALLWAQKTNLPRNNCSCAPSYTKQTPPPPPIPPCPSSLAIKSLWFSTPGWPSSSTISSTIPFPLFPLPKIQGELWGVSTPVHHAAPAPTICVPALAIKVPPCPWEARVPALASWVPSCPREGLLTQAAKVILYRCGARQCGLKLVKSNKITSFNWCPNTWFEHCSNKYKNNAITTHAYHILCLQSPQQSINLPYSQALLFPWICHTPIKNRGLSVNPWPFPTVLTMKT